MRRSLWGFGSCRDVEWRDYARQLSRDEYDPSFDITPSRLYCAYEVGCPSAAVDLGTEFQRTSTLHSSVKALLDVDSRVRCPAAYDEATEWLLKSGWPFRQQGSWSAITFEIEAKAFLERMEQKYGYEETIEQASVDQGTA